MLYVIDERSIEVCLVGMTISVVASVGAEVDYVRSSEVDSL
jgi:hypothetical protein